MGRKILLLETDEQLRALIVPLLEARQFVVEQDTSGHKALETIADTHPDLVMVGEVLDDIDGIGFIIKLRQKDRDMKVAFLSQSWREAEFFQKVTKELKVAHIFHRPIKSSVFGVQVDALWHDQRRGLPPMPGASPAAVPQPMGCVPAPLGMVPQPGRISHPPGMVMQSAAIPAPANEAPGSGNTPWPAVGTTANYTIPASLPAPATEPAPPIPSAPLSQSSINLFADATLLNFRQKFSKSLPTRVKQIEQIIIQVNRESPDSNLIIEGRRLSHNLKGTSRSCGFDNLGNLSERIEYSLRDMLEVPEIDHTRAWGHIDSALLAAKKEVELVKLQFSDYAPTAEELANLNPDAAKAKVLVVSSEAVLSGCEGGKQFPQPAHHAKQGIPLEIITVEKHSDALDKAAKTQLDAALIEIPSEGRESAFQLARELRSMVGYETLPLGFISRNDDSDRAEAAHAGASLFLEKPYCPDTLQQALQHLIAIREGGRSRVLIVDDDEDFTELISSTLGNEGMLVKALNDPTHVLDVLEEYTPDLVLLDVMMPGILGFDVCKKIRGTGRWQDLPIIFLTAQTDLASRLSAFDCGGDDYLPKPVINVELLKRVKVRLDRARMQRERQDRDLLTGLLLRRAFGDHLSALISESERHNFNFTLCLMDVDHFKKVNDSFGHMSGDRVLAYIGKLLRKRFRVEDLRGRWGGEEFMLAFKHERKETMQKALNRVLEELKKVEFKGDQGESFYTAFSAGMVDFPEDGTTIHDLVLQADRRLYIAKANGRSQIVITG